MDERAIPSRTPKVTLSDIAQRAGVGLGTASRALSNSSGVAAETRRRVQQVADEMDYVISPAASDLARGTTGRVALVVPHLARWFFGATVEGVQSALRAADLDVLLFPVSTLDARRQFFERLPARRKVDALMVVAFQVNDTERRRLDAMNVHIVAAGGQNAAYPHVTIDDYVAGRRAVDHLLNLGHERIAMLEAVDPDQPGLIPPRSAAYRDALTERGISLDDELTLSAVWGAEEGSRSMGRLLGMRNPPTAVYAHSDEVALGAVRTLRRAGLRVPEDMSVIGIDDHPLAELTDLTTVRQDPFGQGAAAGQMLVDLLRGRTAGETLIWPTELIVRHSTVPPCGAEQQALP